MSNLHALRTLALDDFDLFFGWQGSDSWGKKLRNYGKQTFLAERLNVL